MEWARALKKEMQEYNKSHKEKKPEQLKNTSPGYNPEKEFINEFTRKDYESLVNEVSKLHKWITEIHKSTTEGIILTRDNISGLRELVEKNYRANKSEIKTLHEKARHMNDKVNYIPKESSVIMDSQCEYLLNEINGLRNKVFETEAELNQKITNNDTRLTDKTQKIAELFSKSLSLFSVMQKDVEELKYKQLGFFARLRANRKQRKEMRVRQKIQKLMRKIKTT
jgi:hypothetical protein